MTIQRNQGLSDYGLNFAEIRLDSVPASSNPTQVLKKAVANTCNVNSNTYKKIMNIFNTNTNTCLVQCLQCLDSTQVLMLQGRETQANNQSNQCPPDFPWAYNEVLPPKMTKNGT